MNKQIAGLEIGSDKYYELTDALERVLEQIPATRRLAR